MRCSVYIVLPAVLSCSYLRLHQTLEMKNIFKLEKIKLQLTFNPGLTINGFRTTWLWCLILWCILFAQHTIFIGRKATFLLPLKLINLWNICARDWFVWRHRSYIHNIKAFSEIKTWKSWGLYRIRTHDLWDTGAVLCQLGYQADWKLVTLSLQYILIGRARTLIAEVTGLNLVDALIFTGFFFPIGLLWWSFFTFIYNRCSNWWIISYILHNIPVLIKQTINQSIFI